MGIDLVLNCLNTPTTIALLSLIFLCLFLFRFSKAARGREAPLVPEAWPILGHLPLLSRTQTPHRTLATLADKYGPIFTVKLGATRGLVISNWELAKDCFTTNDIAVSSRPKSIAVELMSYNQAFIGWAPYGPYWRQLRKIVTLAFLSNRKIEQLSHIRVFEVQTSIKELVAESNNNNNFVLVEMKQWFAQLTLNMVLRMLIGKRYFGAMENVTNEEKAQAQRCLDNIRDFMRLIGISTVGDVVPSLRWLDIGDYQKAMKETAKEFDKMLSQWLEEHRQKMSSGEKVVRDGDFIDTMLSVRPGYMD